LKHLFNPESTFWVFASRMVDLVWLSLLWCVCCIPVVTIVPATAALYYVTLKIVNNDEGKITGTFFKAFKENLRQGIPLTFVFLLLFMLLYMDCIYVFSMQGSFSTILFILFLILAFLATATMCYTCALQAKFSNTVFNTVKTAFFLSLQNFPKTILIVLLHLSPVILFFIQLDTLFRLLPILIAYIPSCIAYLCSMVYSKIFSQLLTEN